MAIGKEGNVKWVDVSSFLLQMASSSLDLAVRLMHPSVLPILC